MDDVVEKLQVRFPELKFEYCSPANYISTLLQPQEDIIICYKVEVRGSQMSHYVTNKSSTSVLDPSSCFGNPLEAPYSMEESVLNITLAEKLPVCDQFPLTSFEALQVKNYCNLKLKPSVLVVILCDSECMNQPCRVLHGCQHHKHWTCHSWADYYKTESTSLPTLTELLRDHSSKVSGPLGKKLKYIMQLRSRSVLCSLEDVTDRSLTCCKISAQFDWSEMSVKPPLDSITNASLVIDVNMDRAVSISMARIWKQLVLLQSYVDILENQGDNSSKELQLPSGHFLLEELGINCGITEETVTSRMKNALFVPGSFAGQMTSLAEDQPLTLSKAVKFFSRPNRPALELTDIIWINLIGCDSYRTLQNCFKELVTLIGSARQTTSLKRTNICRLAHLLSSDQMLFIKCMDPLEMLVEMGIEKLRKELLSIFDCVQMRLSSLNMPTCKFTELSSSERWLDISKGWLTWLARLYSSLNVLYCIETVFHSPPLPLFFPLVQDVVKRLSSVSSAEAFESLAQLINNPDCSFSLPVSMKLLSACTMPDTEMFDDWSLTLRSSSEYRKVTSIYYRSLKCKIPYKVNDTTEGNVMNNTLLNSTCPDVSYLVHCIDSHSVSDCFSS